MRTLPRVAGTLTVRTLSLVDRTHNCEKSITCGWNSELGKLSLVDGTETCENSLVHGTILACTQVPHLVVNLGFSKHWPSGPMLSISRNVHMFVCLCVCSLLRYRLKVFLPPLPEIGCPIFLEIRNPWGKVMERSGLRFEIVCFEVV